MSLNWTCNSTLDDMRITSEVPIAGNLTFHQLGLIISGSCAAIAIILSSYLIWMHALHYTKPYEQRHIIRVLFMVPVYAVASFMSFWFYYHAIYYQVLSDCYEAFTIASFFALLCHYIAPNLHEQKDYFRGIQPRPWVWPLNWMSKCCCGDRGPWRTPRSGLTWFNIIWLGIYQYCFIRVTMTVTAVLTQYFGRYCESSNSPVFAHIWILVIEGVAVTIAMYCVIQFYVQLRKDLKPYSPLLKVTAIKLVIFLSFWQTFMISILTSSLNVLKATSTVAYPDIKVGVPSMLLCIEMACFAVLHIFAYPYKPYVTGSQSGKYPSSHDPSHPDFNDIGPKQGGPLGIYAILDAMNPWDFVKASGRGLRWAFVGVRHREDDISYKLNSNEITPESTRTVTESTYKGEANLPIAEQFRRSKFGLPTDEDEGAGLITHAQPNPTQKTGAGRYTPARERYDPETGQEISTGGSPYQPENLNQVYSQVVGQQTSVAYNEDSSQEIGVATSTYESEPQHWNERQEVPGMVQAQRPQVVQSSSPQPQSSEARQAPWGSNKAPPPFNPYGRDMRNDYGGQI